MLGERRSKAAFSAGFPEAVRKKHDTGFWTSSGGDHGNGGFDGLMEGETEENLQNDSLSEQA